MIGVIIRTLKYANYRMISVLTQVSRELYDARLWSLAIRIQYPQSLMGDNCEHHPDHLRYLIARTGDNIAFNLDNYTMYEYTRQLKTLDIYFQSVITPEICKKYLGRYLLVDNEGEVIYSGSYIEMVCRINTIYDDEDYIVVDTCAFPYIFKNITIHESVNTVEYYSLSEFKELISEEYVNETL